MSESRARSTNLEELASSWDPFVLELMDATTSDEDSDSEASDGDSDFEDFANEEAHQLQALPPRNLSRVASYRYKRGVDCIKDRQMVAAIHSSKKNTTGRAGVYRSRSTKAISLDSAEHADQSQRGERRTVEQARREFQKSKSVASLHTNRSHRNVNRRMEGHEEAQHRRSKTNAHEKPTKGGHSRRSRTNPTQKERPDRSLDRSQRRSRSNAGRSRSHTRREHAQVSKTRQSSKPEKERMHRRRPKEGLDTHDNEHHDNESRTHSQNKLKKAHSFKHTRRTCSPSRGKLTRQLSSKEATEDRAARMRGLSATFQKSTRCMRSIDQSSPEVGHLKKEVSRRSISANAA